MASKDIAELRSRFRPLLASLSIAVAFVILVCLMANPRWESNDDVAMSMVAHGYGLAAYGSPNLMFSNVLWGYLVRILPTIYGVFGYSLATLGVLTLVSAAIIHSLVRLGAGYPTASLAIILVMSRPILFPQFTINAGLLTCAAVLGLFAYAKTARTTWLVGSGMLAFLGYLVRNLEFALVLCVALPVLPWLVVRKERRVQLAGLVLICAAVGAALFNHWSTSGQDWIGFWQLNSVRAPFTDFGAAGRLLARPDLMAHYGLTRNDVELISSWFFVDRQIADPAKLAAVLADLGPTGGTLRLDLGISAIQSIANWTLLPVLIPALFLTVLNSSRSLILSWLLCLAAIFAMGFVGRPGVLRVYIPVLSLLALLPIASSSFRSNSRKSLIAIVLAGANLANAYQLAGETRASDTMLTQVQSSPYTPRSIAVWGDSLPFEYAYPLFAPNERLRQLKILSLGVFTFAPFAIALAEEKAGNGLIAQLTSSGGVLISASDGRLKLLATYCSEHLNTQVEVTVVYEPWSVYKLKCRAPWTTLP